MVEIRQPVRIEPLGPAWPTVLPELQTSRPGFDQLGQIAGQCIPMLMARLLDPGGIWIARVGVDVVAMQVCVPLAGASCLFWPCEGDPEFADRLVHAGLDWARSIGCKVAQALAPGDGHAYAASLVRCGFRLIARVRQLAHDLRDLPQPERTPLRFDSYRPSQADVFAATLERTYLGTLDFPELNGKRTIEEILAGHRAQGRFHPECWWLACDGAAPVGVIMLAEMPDGLTWELAYLGLIPEVRGRRLGRAMALHALRAARGFLATRLTLAVDERNTPARQLYQSLGFHECGSNDVLLYFWS